MFQILMSILVVYVLACYLWGGYVALRLLTTGRRRPPRPVAKSSPTAKPTNLAERPRDKAAA